MVNSWLIAADPVQRPLTSSATFLRGVHLYQAPPTTWCRHSCAYHAVVSLACLVFFSFFFFFFFIVSSAFISTCCLSSLVQPLTAQITPCGGQHKLDALAYTLVRAYVACTRVRDPSRVLDAYKPVSRLWHEHSNITGDFNMACCITIQHDVHMASALVELKT
jgi:hypothetical protein